MNTLHCMYLVYVNFGTNVTFDLCDCTIVLLLSFKGCNEAVSFGKCHLCTCTCA